jgi:hypothetical protein
LQRAVGVEEVRLETPSRLPRPVILLELEPREDGGPADAAAVKVADGGFRGGSADR